MTQALGVAAVTILVGCAGPPGSLTAQYDAGADGGSRAVASPLPVIEATDARGPFVSPCPGSADAAEFAFADITECAGLGGNQHVAVNDYLITGQAWGDYDNDGHIDLYVTSSVGPNRLYRNRGDGTFELSALAGAVALPGHTSGGAVFVDYDNDGWKDLYVTGFGNNVLFRNLGGTGFADVTDVAGVHAAGKSESASFGDYDGDGLLDLYVAQWDCITDCEQWVEPNSDRLYHNEGDGTFSDQSHLLGKVERTGLGLVAVFSDFDNDGDVDIYLINDKGSPGAEPVNGPMNRNVLWRNDGPGCDGWCFTEVAVALGADARIDGMGIAVADFDGDGDLDYFMTHNGPSVLLRNDGAAGFVNVSDAAATARNVVGWGAVFFDYDNDGWPDLYLAVGSAYTAPPDNSLFRNQAGAGFVDVLPAAADETPGYTIGVNYADYDNDGALDLVIGNRGEGYRLLRNLAAGRTGHRWIRFRLAGGGPVNRDAVGARVIVSSDDGRQQLQEVKLGSSLGGNNDPALHFGLATANVTSALIRWPDGTEQVLHAPQPNREHRVAYPASGR